MRISTFVRALRPVDLLLPVGAALVSAGLQKLTEREMRKRAQLAELQHLVGVHRDALAAAGVPLDEDGLLVDERHPLDVETLPTVFPWHAPASEPAPAKSGRNSRGWKLAALALAGVVGVTLWANRGELVDELLQRAGFDDWPTDENLESKLGEPNEDSSPWTGDRCTTCDEPAAWFPDDQVWRHFITPTGKPRWSSHEVTLPAAVNESNADPAAAGEPYAEWCGWAGCDYRSPHPATLALHRNACTCRPANAHVPE